MKKNIFLVVGALLLTGCVPNLVIDETGSNQNQGQNNNPSEQGNQETPPQEQGQEGGHNQGTLNLQEYTATVSVSNIEFASNFPTGTNFTTSSADKNAQLKEFLDDQLEYENLISIIEIDYCSTRKYNSVTYLQINTGKLGANEGFFTWKSTEKIYKVEVVALNYANPYTDYQTGNEVSNLEGNAKFYIDTKESTLETADGEYPSETTFTKDYSEGTNSFKITAKGGRVLIKEFKITWRG